MKTVSLRAVALVLLALAGCKAKGPVSTHERIASGVEPLRSAFNADVGKVRVLMLVAPT